jgi:large subunit ribosomal protein L10
MPTPRKEATVRELREVSEQHSWALVVGYRGLSNPEMEGLRRAVGAANGTLRIVKNSLFRIASKGTSLEPAASLLDGPCAIVFGDEAPAVAKAIADFAKGSQKLVVHGGVLDGRVLAKEGVDTVAQIPPRQVLYSLLVAGLEGPISGLTQSLHGIISKLVYALDEIKEQRQDAA